MSLDRTDRLLHAFDKRPKLLAKLGEAISRGRAHYEMTSNSRFQLGQAAVNGRLAYA
jgi:hypothetical protein